MTPPEQTPRLQMHAVIAAVHPHSPAEAAGARPGDIVTAVNARRDLEDMFDYQFESADCDALALDILRADEPLSLVIRKPADDDAGIVFSSPVFTPIRTCNNACPFCFIDQQPDGLRASLYVKDDDYRLSYFANTYITLTNLTPRDRARIAQLRPGPLYISVHASDPEVRRQLLANPKAGGILEELRWLKSLEIPFHCQIVVCPGINDGPVLARSLEDLFALRPEALSVAVVPVGLTQYRDHLPTLSPVLADTARTVVDCVEAFRRSRPGAADFVFLSDEFYFKAGLPLPAYGDYADFPQLDDGVGTARMLLEDFFALPLPKTLDPPANYLLLTGKLAAMVLQPIATRLNEIDGLYVDILAVESQFWGGAVDVAGLVTGTDIRAALSEMDVSGYRAAIIPSVMLKESSDCFLDDQSVSELEAALALPFRIVRDPYSARELVDLLLGN